LIEVIRFWILWKKEEGRRKKEEGRRKKEEGRRKKENAITCYQALPGNTDREALPPISPATKRGRASGHEFPGRAWEPVKPVKVS